MKTVRLGVVISVLFVAFQYASAQQSATRVVIYKKLDPAAAATTSSIFRPITTSLPSAAGFTLLADYAIKAVYKGPSAGAAALISGLKAEGYEAAIATELDTFRFHDFVFDADLGLKSPSPPVYTPTGSFGLYLIALESFPTDTWLADLRSRGARILGGLPPNAYLIRVDRTVAVALQGSSGYVRGVFPLAPALKKVLLTPEPPDGELPFRNVVIRASEESPSESILAYLTSVSHSAPVETFRSSGEVAFNASLTDVDIATLITFETVFEISPVGKGRISSERQAMLVALDGSETGGGATLPDIIGQPYHYTYTEWLVNKGFPAAANTFDNTKVGIIDTGFDNGDNSYAGIHPDFKFQFGEPQQQITIVTDLTSGWPFSEDRDRHGTLVTSIVTGYPSATSGRSDTGNYRWGLGLAPTVRVAADKFLNCLRDEGGTLEDAVGRVTSLGVNVINMSFNSDMAHGRCGYNDRSRYVDDTTRSGYLFTISAGNKPENCTGNLVGAPATAKNAIAAGSTDNFTLDYQNVDKMCSSTDDDICAWDTFTANRDARFIPTYSGTKDPASLVKPDLVAPSTRVTGPKSRGSVCTSILCRECVAQYTGPDVTYGMSAGTSFSAPAVAGASAVVRKWYRNLRSLDPSPAMTKAILINGARDIGGPPATPPCPAAAVRDESFMQIACVGHIPDPYQGWGMLSFERLLSLSLSGYYFYDQGTAVWPGSAWSKTLYVTNGARPTHITLVWTDHSGTTGSTYTVSNNLLLVACVPFSYPCWTANTFDTNGYSNPYPPTWYRDTVNNVKQVIIPPYTFASGARVYLSIQPDAMLYPPQDFALMVENAHE